MGLRFRGLIGPKLSTTDEGVTNEKENVGAQRQTQTGVVANDKEATAAVHPDSSSLESSTKEKGELQFGVQVAEATLQVWTKKTLVAAYVFIWLINFLNAFASGTTSMFTTYATSSFEAHSLTATTSIIAGLIPGLTKLAYAKFMDNFGRPHGFALSVFCITIGLVMMAACQNVETYCAAQVFYSVGYSWIDFTITIFIADTSKLKNRAFWIAYSASPYLITTWIYPYAAAQVIADGGIGWRWGYGIFAVLFPIVCSPLWVMFYWGQRKAVNAGLIQTTPHNRNILGSIVYYGREFDIVGIILAAGGIGLFLLSFSLYSYQPLQFASSLIICFIVFGLALIAAFVVWEKFFAPITFIPWYLIKNRTVFFTYTMMASLYTAWYLWDSYFYSVLVVLFNQEAQYAGYIMNTYTMGSTLWSFVMGALIRYNGRLKWPAVYFGVPMTILGVALMIHFRQPDMNIGYIVMTQIFVAVGGGTLVICEQMTVMAVSKHKDIPAILAMEGMVASMGMAIGSTVAAAIWTGTFPNNLQKYLPAEAQDSLAEIYDSIYTQLDYAVGTPTRDGINMAYGETQKIMLIAATAMYSVTWVSTWMWESIDVRDIAQYSGATMW